MGVTLMCYKMSMTHCLSPVAALRDLVRVCEILWGVDSSGVALDATVNASFALQSRERWIVA